jgi:hypothetical protein
VVGPAHGIVPDPGTGVPSLPAPPAASPSLNAVVEALKRGDNEAALKGARGFVKAQPGNATGQELLRIGTTNATSAGAACIRPGLGSP